MQQISNGTLYQCLSAKSSPCSEFDPMQKTNEYTANWRLVLASFSLHTARAMTAINCWFLLQLFNFEPCQPF